MTKEEGLLPEERLLRLIKKAKKEPEKEANVSQGPVSPEAAPEKRQDIPDIKVRRKIRLSHIPMQYIITGVAAVSIVVIVMAGLCSNKESEELRRLESLVASISEEAETEPARQEERPSQDRPERGKPGKDSAASFDEYQKLLNEKSIFTTPAVSKKGTDRSAETTLQNQARGLRLVGIVPGDEPQAIIEDKQSAQTFFLIKGEKIGDIEIADISNGRVTLRLEDETVNLSL